MPRPQISKSTRFRVIQEAGNRCAVCGHSSPVVLAHIVSLATGGSSEEENLIALCPNCHARSDWEGWSESTLREYKERPWALRRTEAGESETPKKTVKVTMTVETDDLNGIQIDKLTKAVARFLETKDSDIKIVGVEEG